MSCQPPGWEEGPGHWTLVLTKRKAPNPKTAARPPEGGEQF